jgi:phosphoribosylformimino-5-aminoimidazole carboxamide ribotide isomerase
MDSETVYSDDPLLVARRWESEGADRLHLVDLDGAVAGNAVHFDLISSILKAVKIPVEVGGGIRRISVIEQYLSAGASWVILGTSALQNFKMVQEAARAFPQKIIVGIDVKKGAVAIQGWTALHADGLMDVALRVLDAGVAQLILTDIEKDGMLAGPNFSLFETVAAAVKLPLIASGGISTLGHLQQLSKTPGIEGAIIGKALYTGDISLPDAIATLRQRGPC